MRPAVLALLATGAILSCRLAIRRNDAYMRGQAMEMVRRATVPADLTLVLDRGTLWIFVGGFGEQGPYPGKRITMFTCRMNDGSSAGCAPGHGWTGYNTEPRHD